jgi:4-aminobutyrate aminotransferase
MSDSEKRLIDRHRAVMPEWLALNYEDPISLVKGDGRRVWDSDGNEYLDFFGGIVTTSTGHNLPEVVEAIREQAGKILHSSTLYLIEPAIALAERIVSLSPIPNAKVFFCCSGSEANETALLLAAIKRRSNQVIALRNSYHGRSFATVAISGNRGWSPSAHSPLTVSYVQSGYRFRSPFKDLSDSDFIKACVDDLRNVIETTTSGPIACMIAEPIQGVGGYATPPDGFFGAMKEVLDEYDALFISDEVQTAWGRTGEHFWGIEAHDVVPDAITFAKGIGNGLTMGGVIARSDLMDSIVDATSLSTFGGNPLSAVGALANLDYILDNDLQTNCLKVGEHLLGRLRELAGAHSVIGDVRGKGLLIALELIQPNGAPDKAAAARLMEETRKRGLLIGKGGLYGNVIRFAPPMTLTTEEADEGADILADSFEAMSTNQ